MFEPILVLEMENGQVISPAPDDLDALHGSPEWTKPILEAALRGGRYGWDDVRKALFPKGPPQPHTLDELKDGKKTYIRRKHARG